MTIKMWQSAGEQQLSRVGEQIRVLRMSRSAKDLDGGQRQEGPQVQNIQVAQYTSRPTHFWDADHVPFNT